MPFVDSQQTYTPTAAAREAFIPTMRALAQAYQAFYGCSDRHIRQMGLTSPQFDVIATLGGTAGMTMKEVAAKTLVTKGTLTGIVDRLEQKGLVRREVPPENRRSFRLVLTETGEAVFNRIFPSQIAHLKQYFEHLEPSEIEQLRFLLDKLRSSF